MKKTSIILAAIATLFFASCKKQEATFTNLNDFDKWFAVVEHSGDIPGVADEKTGIQPLVSAARTEAARPSFSLKNQGGDSFTLTASSLPHFQGSVTLNCVKSGVEEATVYPASAFGQKMQRFTITSTNSDVEFAEGIIYIREGKWHVLDIHYYHGVEYKAQLKDEDGKLVVDEENNPVLTTDIAVEEIHVNIAKDWGDNSKYLK